jgi:hypothetical protein
MRRFIVIAAAGLSLAGCSSFSWDAFKPTPPTAQVQLESAPPGVDARTSIGPSCRTPCSVVVTPPDSGFTVTYTLNKFVPVTIPVRTIRVPGDFLSAGTVTVDPNPVFAELHPVGPPPKPVRMRPKRPRPPRGAAAPPPAGSPFPEPAQAPPPTTR